MKDVQSVNIEAKLKKYRSYTVVGPCTKNRKIIGKKINKLLVLEVLGVNSRNREVLKCLCDCGTITASMYHTLVNNQTTSCGCLKARNNREKDYKRRFSDKDLCVKYKYKNYGFGAKKRNLEFILTINEFEKLIFNNCYYCNSKPNNIFKIKFKRNKDAICYYNGIDRIDNKVGYIITNCISCCSICNFMKSKMLQNEFLLHIEKIYKKCQNPKY